MLRSLMLFGIGLLLMQQQTLAQAVAKPTYMQLFYEGANWVTGQPVLHYSPAFRGKTGELVREDSTSSLSPGAALLAMPASIASTPVAIEGPTVINNGTSTSTYVRGKDGKLRPQTAADRQQEYDQEKDRFNRQLNLISARGALARATLLSALNATAADGWEVVQMTSWGGKDGLVYLLQRR